MKNSSNSLLMNSSFNVIQNLINDASFGNLLLHSKDTLIIFSRNSFQLHQKNTERKKKTRKTMLPYHFQIPKKNIQLGI